MTISIWLWIPQLPTDWAMVVNDWSGSCGQFHMGLVGGSADIANFTADGNCSAVLTRENAPLPVGSWQHVVFVADGSMMCFYRNGQPAGAAQPYDGTLYQPFVKSFGIGMKPNADGSGPGAYFWQGNMDDLGIWRRGLSPGEIQAIYVAGLAGQDLTTATLPRLAITPSAGAFTIAWPASATGFRLETTTRLGPSAAWTTVSGVVNNSITISPTNATSFYRLTKP
jgi:hypothetical protein